MKDLPHIKITLKGEDSYDVLDNTQLLELPAMAIAGSSNCS